MIDTYSSVYVKNICRGYEELKVSVVAGMAHCDAGLSAATQRQE